MKKKDIDLLKIQIIQKELKEANKLLDEYFRKEALVKREEKLKKYSLAERSAYWSGRMDANNERALVK